MEKCSCVGRGFRVAYKTAKYNFLYFGTKFEVTTFRCPDCGATRDNNVSFVAEPNIPSQATVTRMEGSTDANLAYNVTRFPVDGGHGQSQV